MNIVKQIKHWKKSALSDLETAEILIDKKKFLHGLFFCHLAIEKILKAHFVKIAKTIPPKTHDLIYLLKKIDISLEEKFEFHLAILMKYQLESRYPENLISSPSKVESEKYLSTTRELLNWLIIEL